MLRILGFAKGKLSLHYLGVLIVGRDFRSSDCVALTDQLEACLARGRNEALSYGGKVQLVIWVIMCKLCYWFHVLKLLMEVLKKVRNVIYMFI